jgi:hypothetical protein
MSFALKPSTQSIPQQMEKYHDRGLDPASLGAGMQCASEAIQSQRQRTLMTKIKSTVKIANNNNST